MRVSLNKPQESRTELKAIQDAVQSKLKQRAALREEKASLFMQPAYLADLLIPWNKQAFLHLLLKISESVSRLESLLLIASPDQDPLSPDLSSKKPLAGEDTDQ